MMSLGTCRLVMPRSESTIANRGPAGHHLGDRRLDRRPLARRAARRSRPARCPSRCRDRRRPPRARRRTLEHRREVGADGVPEQDRIGHLHHRRLEMDREQHVLVAGVVDLLGEEVAQRPLRHERAVDDLALLHRDRRLEHVTVPSPASSSMRRSSAASIVTDCSFERKSWAPIVATWVFESGDQAPIECGCLRAYSLTAFGARRSELPSRRTGLTADPLTLS